MADRDELIDPALDVLRDRGIEVSRKNIYRSDMGAVLDAVLPLIEAGLREQLAAEIEAAIPPAGRGLIGGAETSGMRKAASIVRGATADTDPAGDNTTERT